MAERFGSQAHPTGGVRFGSQTYAAVSSVAGALSAAESGADVFAASLQPTVSGSALLVEQGGADALVVNGTSSLVHTMQARESSTPDSFNASATVVDGSLRFGSQDHPAGGLRFGSQASAALGPSGPMSAIESGADSAAVLGWRAGTAYQFAIYDIRAAFVVYSSESLTASISGTVEDGYNVLLPVSGVGTAFTWELNEFSNPSLRLSRLTGATNLADIPWYVWDGSGWTSALFDVTDAVQGAVFAVESTQDTFVCNGSQTRFGNAPLVETGADFVVVSGAVQVRGALSIAESGADGFAATGAPAYSGDLQMLEISIDFLAADGAIPIAGGLDGFEDGADSFLVYGSRDVTGSLDAAETGADAIAAFGRLPVAGALAAAEAGIADVFSAALGVHVAGQMSALEVGGGDALASIGQTERLGAFASVETGADSFSVGGAILIAGALSAKEDDDRFSAVGFRVFTGGLAAVEVGADRFLGRGLAGDLPAVMDFDGHIVPGSGTDQYVVRSRQQAAAA